MTDGITDPGWTFYRFGLLVTGECEAEFLPTFLRSIQAAGNCTFETIRRVEQRSPISSTRRQLRMTGSNKSIPDRDAEQIGLPARNYLNRHQNSFVLLVDDLERDRRPRHQETFERYRAAFDSVLPGDLRCRASVHFLVNMLEAYYFADPDTLNEVLDIDPPAFNGDVETIPNPKAELKKLTSGFDEVRHGQQIVARLDLCKVLGNPETCTSLRTLFKWCCQAKQEPESDRFQLRSGRCCPVTGGQLSQLCQRTPK